MSGAWGFVAVPRVNGRCAEGKVAAEQLASAKGESPLAQKRKALALQVLFVVEVRGIEPLSDRTLTWLSTCLSDVWWSLALARRRALA